MRPWLLLRASGAPAFLRASGAPAFLALGLASGIGCHHAPTGPDVLLISLDTTRADAISAWGLAPAGREDLRGAVVTPELDALAAGGVRYAWAFAHAPSTLASHATVFLGRDPHAIAVPRNGFPVPPERETLAERLRDNGWATAAVIGSSALARPMGVDRGFQTWDEDLSVKRKRRHEATAAEVTDRALQVISERDPGRPLFLFVHYFDAHGPYQSPVPARFNQGEAVGADTIEALARQCRAGKCDMPEAEGRIADVRGAYLDEVAYVDAQLGRLLASPAGPAGRVVVVFGDHGEMLGEDAVLPFGHGADVDPSASHVPLIMSGKGLSPGVVTHAVGLQDVSQTLLAILGDARPFGRGTNLSVVGFVPMEATQPSGRGPGWNNLQTERAVAHGQAMLVRPAVPRASGAPAVGEPQAFSLGGEVLRLTDALPMSLGSALTAWDAQAPSFRAAQMDKATQEGLEALGYVE